MPRYLIDISPVNVIPINRPELLELLNAVAVIHSTTPLDKLQCTLTAPDSVNFFFNTVDGMHYEQDVHLLPDNVHSFNFNITGSQWKNNDSGARIKARESCIQLIRLGVTGIKIKMEY